MQNVHITDLNSFSRVQQRLTTLAGISPEALARIDAAIERELTALGASAATLSAAEKSVCLKSSGRFGGQAGLEELAAFRAKKAADEKIVAGIPKERLVLLRILVGDDPSKIASKWNEMQAPSGKGSR